MNIETPTMLNPLEPVLAVDPYPTYAGLRGTDPVHQSAIGAWALTRYEDVATMLGDTDTYQHQYVTQQKVRSGPDVEDEAYMDYFRRMVSVMDDPDHRRIRKLLMQAFTNRTVKSMRDQASHITNTLIDQQLAQGGMDLVKDFAYPLPMRIIGAILGLPEEDHDVIGGHATALNPVLEFLPMAPDVLARANDAINILADYFRVLADKRRADPTDDLFSAMVHASEDGERLTSDELIANAILLYVAGHETTAAGLSLAVLSLHRNPDQLALLQAQPELRANAIEELFRYDTPGQATARVATKDVVIGDRALPAGSIVLGYIGAANRDPLAFPDPNSLDITRDFSKLPRPLTFGGGGHLCLGRQLALQEMDVALETLMTRCPDMTLETLDPDFRPTPLMRGLASLQVRW